MADKNENANTHEDGQSDEENMSLEEWTLLDRMAHDNNEKTASVQKRSMIRSKKYVDAEVAREAIQVLEPQFITSETLETHNNENHRTKHFAGNDDESDGQTVITGNHEENSESQIRTISNPLINQIVTPIGTFTNIIIACSLAALIGFSIGCIVSKGETQLSENNVDFGYAGKMACSLEGEKSAKRTVSPDIDTGTKAMREQSEKISKQVSYNQQFMSVDENNYLKNDGSLRAMLEKVQFSLDILCSMINNNIHNSRESNEYNAVCAKPFAIMNLIELTNNMQNLVMDIGFIEDRSDEWFINNMNSKLNDISIAFVNDLSVTMRNSVAKIERKFNKMKHKLDQRLCFLQYTIGDDARMQGIFNKYESLIKGCPMQKSINEVKIEPSKYKLGKNEQYIRKHIHMHAVGPEVKVGGELDNDSSDVRVDYKDYRRKENSLGVERDKLYRWKRDQKSQKKSRKGDFTSETETIKSKKFKTEKNHERIMVLPDIVENYSDDTKRYCDANSCTKQQIGDRKNDPDQEYGNWQFQRSEGRFNWRKEKNVLSEDDALSWNDKRATSRRSARDKY